MALLEIHQAFAATIDRHNVTLPQRKTMLCARKPTNANVCRHFPVGLKFLRRSACTPPRACKTLLPYDRIVVRYRGRGRRGHDASSSTTAMLVRKNPPPAIQ